MELGDFPNRKSGAVWLNRKEASGVLPCVGYMKDAQGRMVVKVHLSGWQPKADNLRHEIIGTKIALLYPGFWFGRGYKLSDCLPDWIMSDSVTSYEGETDCGSMKKQQVLARWKKHECGKKVLVVTAPHRNPESRLKQLLEWGETLENGYFTTLERLQRFGPHARVWEYVNRGSEPLAWVKPAVPSPFQGYTDDTPQVLYRQIEKPDWRSGE